MTIPSYTVVVGVDRKHLEQLSLTWPTWKKHKPSLLSSPIHMFYDCQQLQPKDIHRVVDHPDIRMSPWPPTGVDYPDGDDKWTNGQRHKMLAGYIYVASMVHTEYWLKIDTDVVATGCDDWINADWFNDNPAIIAPPWGFTKPPDQIQKLDYWSIYVNNCVYHPPSKELGGSFRFSTGPLKLHPMPGEDRVNHPRICSWCGFFSTDFTRICARLADVSCGYGHIPVASQDGYQWYVAKRMDKPIVRVQMKQHGWEVWSTYANIVKHSEESMQNGKQVVAS